MHAGVADLAMVRISPHDPSLASPLRRKEGTPDRMSRRVVSDSLAPTHRRSLTPTEFRHRLLRSPYQRCAQRLSGGVVEKEILGLRTDDWRFRFPKSGPPFHLLNDILDQLVVVVPAKLFKNSFLALRHDTLDPLQSDITFFHKASRKRFSDFSQKFFRIQVAACGNQLTPNQI